MTSSYVTIIALLLLAVVAAMLKQAGGRSKAFPYVRKGALLTAAERSFLGKMRSSNGASARDNRKQCRQGILGLQHLSKVPRHSMTAPVHDETSQADGGAGLSAFSRVEAGYYGQYHPGEQSTKAC